MIRLTDHTLARMNEARAVVPSLPHYRTLGGEIEAGLIRHVRATGRVAESYALILRRLPAEINLSGRNGDCLVAIVRGRSVTTFLPRRANQPMTPNALDVAAVIDCTVSELGNGTRPSLKG